MITTWEVKRTHVVRPQKQSGYHTSNEKYFRSIQTFLVRRQILTITKVILRFKFNLHACAIVIRFQFLLYYISVCEQIIKHFSWSSSNGTEPLPLIALCNRLRLILLTPLFVSHISIAYGCGLWTVHMTIPLSTPTFLNTALWSYRLIMSSSPHLLRAY